MENLAVVLIGVGWPLSGLIFLWLGLKVQWQINAIPGESWAAPLRDFFNRAATGTGALPFSLWPWLAFVGGGSLLAYGGAWLISLNMAIGQSVALIGGLLVVFVGLFGPALASVFFKKWFKNLQKRSVTRKP